MKRLLALFALLVGAPLAVWAHGYALGAIDIDHPHVTVASATALSAAGYLTLTNSGDTDRLLSITSPLATVTLHESTVDADGVARMKLLEAVDLPPGSMVVFEPGGLHVMFTDLAKPFHNGTTVPATLHFEQAGTIDVMFNVETVGSDSHAHGTEVIE